MTERIIGVDLGGTWIRACLADATGRLMATVRHPTLAEQGPDAVLGRIKEAIAQVCRQAGDATIVGIGIAAPGPLDPETGVVLCPPNLPGWDHVPLRDLIQIAFELPVMVHHDASLACLAEQRLGAGRGCAHVLYLTISTGIGAGIISGGVLLSGAHGVAGEAGHMVVEPHGPQCGCGSRGCLEVMAAGPAIARYAVEMIREGQSSSLAASECLDEMTGEMVGNAALQGDAVALRAVRRAASYVAVGVLNLIHLFDPQVVILGGGVSRLGDLIFSPVRAHVARSGLTAVQRKVPVVPAELGDQAGQLGAVVLVLSAYRGTL